MTAVSFAEAGEHEAAKEILGICTAQKTTVPRPPKKRPYLSAVIFGTISLTAYLLLFKNEQWVTETYTIGGWYAVFPLGTAFLFSFVHGTFGSSLLSVLGIEAKNK